MTTAFIIFVCTALSCTAFGVGFIVGMDSNMETHNEVFKHYKTSEKAYINGKKVGFSQGWEMCADYCIKQFCWNQKDWNKKHKEEIEEEINYSLREKPYNQALEDVLNVVEWDGYTLDIKERIEQLKK